MTIEHKSFSLEMKVDAQTRRISGYGAIFGNKDSTNDIILPGAFAKTIGKRQVKMLYQHDSDDLLGYWDIVREDDRGLYIEGNIARTSLGDDAYELAKAGALDSMSIGYSVDLCEYNGEGTRMLKEIDLWEVSLVTFPANPLATISAVKSVETVRQFEAFLQKNGYSDRESMLIASKGFAAALTARESRGNKDDARDSRSLETIAESFGKFEQLFKL